MTCSDSRSLLTFRRPGKWGFYFPLFLAVLLMLPRLFSPQFGFFDDGNSLLTSRGLLNGKLSFPVDTYEGRFRPVYWLSFAAIYVLSGPRPFWFFLVHTLVLLVTTWSLMRLIENLGKSRLQAFLTGLAFVCSGPVIENFYTLSKGEPWQTMFLALALWVTSCYQAAHGRWRKAGLVLLIVLLQSLAHMAKETSLFVILPVAVGWWLMERFSCRFHRGTRRNTFGNVSLLAGGLSTIFVLALRLTFVSAGLGRQGYTTRYLFTLSQVGASLLRWSGWLVRDFAYLVPLGIAAVVFMIRSRQCPQGTLLLGALLWAGGWIAVFLPWYFMTGYYMLPATIGLAVIAGSLTTLLLRDFRGGNVGRLAALALTGTLFLASGLNSRSDAGIQLAVDSANARALAWLAQNAPADSTVVVNIRDSESEYPEDIGRLFTTYYQRPDLKVVLPQVLEQGEAEPNAAYILAPYIQNQPLLTVRLGVFEPTQESWNARLETYLADHPAWEQVAQVERRVRLTMVDLPRLFCPFIKTRAFCATPSPLLNARWFVYGWKIYRYAGP